MRLPLLNTLRLARQICCLHFRCGDLSGSAACFCFGLTSPIRKDHQPRSPATNTTTLSVLESRRHRPMNRIERCVTRAAISYLRRPGTHREPIHPSPNYCHWCRAIDRERPLPRRIQPAEAGERPQLWLRVHPAQFNLLIANMSNHLVLSPNRRVATIPHCLSRGETEGIVQFYRTRKIATIA